MASQNKVALITGGVSGMGLAVAKALAARGGWDLHIVDMNPSAGATAVESLPSAKFHQADVTDYDSLARSFRDIFAETRRLHFVFANAGIAEQTNFYERHETGDDGLQPPPPPNTALTRVMFDGVVSTCYLALHYFRLSPKDDDKSVVIASSCAGIYPSSYTPIYTGIKHGSLGLMRALASPYWHFDRVRVNAICPGVVRTNLLNNSQWAQFPPDSMTPLETVQKVVLMLAENDKEAGARTEARVDGVVESKEGVLWGEAVEVIGSEYYFREPPKVSSPQMQVVMDATDIVLQGVENMAVYKG
jgi:NAD(P)-dependent dehydrogenase (short-subunit alcohol dehydrogenase family)